MSKIHITSISPTQFRIQFRDDATDTIVESTEDLNKNLCTMTVQDSFCIIRKTYDGEVVTMPKSEIVEPTFTDDSNLYQKLISICFS